MSYCRKHNTPRTSRRRHRYRRIVREGIRRAPRDPLIATLDQNTYVATVNGVRYDVHLHHVDDNRAYVLVRAPDGRIIGGVDWDGSILCSEDRAGWARGGRTSQRRRRYDVLVAVRDAWRKLRISALFAHAKRCAVSIATRNK